MRTVGLPWYCDGLFGGEAAPSTGCADTTAGSDPTAGPGACVVSLCYSVDLAVLCDALIAAHGRRAFVTVVIDKQMTLRGKTKEQLSRCHLLNTAGIVVRLMEGSCSRADYAAVGRTGGWRGIQHAKGVMVDDRAIVGSTNWTTSSRSNSEVSLLLQASGDDLQTLRDVFWRVVLRSEPFLEAIANGQIQSVAEQSQMVALRSRSLPRLG